jgi:hypothetical protein
LNGVRLELTDIKHAWGELRVFYYGHNNLIQSMPASWTDAIPPDPFVEEAQGKAFFRIVDLVELIKRVEEIKQFILKM